MNKLGSEDPNRQKTENRASADRGKDTTGRDNNNKPNRLTADDIRQTMLGGTKKSDKNLGRGI